MFLSWNIIFLWGFCDCSEKFVKIERDGVNRASLAEWSDNVLAGYSESLIMGISSTIATFYPPNGAMINILFNIKNTRS